MAKSKGTVTGDVQTIANLRRASQAIRGTVLDQILRDALKPMQQKTQSNAAGLRNYKGKYPIFFPQPKTPRRGGHLDQGIVIVKRDQKGQFKREYWLTYSKRARKLAHLVEFGTAPHFQPNLKGGFHHPGSAPRPFARPAYEQEKSGAIMMVGRAAWLRIAASIKSPYGGRRR